MTWSHRQRDGHADGFTFLLTRDMYPDKYNVRLCVVHTCVFVLVLVVVYVFCKSCGICHISKRMFCIPKDDPDFVDNDTLDFNC